MDVERPLGTLLCSVALLRLLRFDLARDLRQSIGGLSYALGVAGKRAES